MKIFRLFTMLMLGIMLNVNLTSCSKEDIVPEGGQVEHPNGIPSYIPNNIIYYITSDNIIVRIQNEDVFGGAKIVSNTYSSTKGYGTIEFASEVTAIELAAFKNQSTLTYIVLPNSVTSIGEGAFEGCSGLTSVTIPNSVESIGVYAFGRCSGLTSVSIGNSVTSIGESAFYYCSGLTSVHISDIAAWCNIVFASSASNPLDYAQHLYVNGEEVKDLIIPNNVKSIGNYAFRGCSGLTSVTIPNSVTSIGESAFEHCSSLTSVTIPNSVTSIGDRTFDECSGLTSVTIGNSVESIGGSVFYGCSGLTSVTIPNSVKSIGNKAFFGCSGLTSIVVEEGNSVYDSRNNCNALIETESNTLLQGCNTTIIPNSVTSIGDAAFSGCSGLTSVTIPNSVTSIGEAAFWGCSGLTSVTIPNSVTSIESSVFSGCSGLTSVTIGNSVESIGGGAFWRCWELKDVYCYAENVPTAYSYPYVNSISYAFDNSSIEKATLHVPAASIGSYRATEPWSDFGKIVALTE